MPKVKLKRREEKKVLKQANADDISIESKSIDVAKSKIALYLARGLDLDDACRLVNCSPKTLNKMRADPQFEVFVQESISRNEMEYLSAIEAAAQMGGQWQAAAWFLERRYPDKYGKRDIIRHEYQLKLQTFMKVLIDVVNKADPKLRVAIVSKLREYNFDGSDLADREFKPDSSANGALYLPEPENVEVDEEEDL